MNLSRTDFLNDVRGHKMTVIKDDGLYRHLRFKKTCDLNQSFSIVTWPGSLCFTGDMGTYVFSRRDDMFAFFRSSPRINPAYWAEKLNAADKYGGVTGFSDELFNRAVISDLVDWMRQNRSCTTKLDRSYLWHDVIQSVIRVESEANGYKKRSAACEFSHYVNDDAGVFGFCDFTEHNVDEFTDHYLWCCYAIIWGISAYDEQIS